MKAIFNLTGSEAKPVIEIIPETDFEKEFIKRNTFEYTIHPGNPIILVSPDKEEK